MLQFSQYPVIHGEKIRIAMLGKEEIFVYTNFHPDLALKHQARYGLEELSPEAKQGLTERLIPQLEKAGELWQYNTIWLIITQNNSTICGAIGFKGLQPDGIIESGAAMYEGYMGLGYMTEATQLLCTWGLQQTEIKKILAYTSIENIASQKVLRKAGFTEVERGEGGVKFEKFG
jgi:RimJ/RimL family protein N-acetyltransferase